MSDRENESLGAEQRTAQDAVRSLPRAAARAEFRARLKADFVAGRLGEGGEVVTLPTRSRRGWWAGTGLALAAVLALAVLGLNRLPGPTLLAVDGTGAVVIDGTRHAAADIVELEALLRPGAHLVVEDGASVDIHYPGTMVWRVAAGTDMVLPGRPGRWFGREVAAEVAMGEVSLRTGPDLAGGGVSVATPEGRALITGTLVSVFRNADLSCFCLYEGQASVACNSGDLGAIPVNKRWVVFNDGREPELLDIAPPHRDHMLGLDTDHGDIFTKP